MEFFFENLIPMVRASHKKYILIQGVLIFHLKIIKKKLNLDQFETENYSNKKKKKQSPVGRDRFQKCS